MTHNTYDYIYITFYLGKAELPIGGIFIVNPFFTYILHVNVHFPINNEILKSKSMKYIKMQTYCNVPIHVNCMPYNVRRTLYDVHCTSYTHITLMTYLYMCN